MKKSIVFIFILFFIKISYSNANNIVIDNVIIPENFVLALQQGMTVPIFLSYNNNSSEKKIANARIAIEKSKLKIINIDYLYDDNEATLSEETINSLNKVTNEYFNDNLEINLFSNNQLKLKLNINTFNLLLIVDKNAFDIKKIDNNKKLTESTVKNITSVLNYDL
ncbi:fimbrial biogenesis outer membrane usher protein, partial [Proteus mirabilis]